MNEPMRNETLAWQQERNRKLFFRFLSFFFVLFLVASAYTIGVESGKQSNASSDVSGDGLSLPVSSLFSPSSGAAHPNLDTFWKAWDIVHERFVDSDSLDSTALVYGAINGMLSATDDPYTVFFNPEENKAFEEDIAGSFEGIGAEIGVKNHILTVVAPLDESPAARAGLRAGDAIIKIDGEVTSDMSIDQAVKKMRGAKGTNVTLTIFHSGDDDTRDVVVTRDTISVKSVKVEWKESDTVAVMKVSQFGETTVDEFGAAAKAVMDKHPKGIAIDLRSNPGGLLDASVRIASLFLPKNTTAVIEEDRNKKQDPMKTLGSVRVDISGKSESLSANMFGGIPTVVLIDSGSASASEILAGALRDNRDDIVLVGEKSFGKGSVQELVPVTKDTSLKVTVAHWLTPSGRQINKEGIAPDVEVERTSEDYNANRDPQLDRALSILREKQKQ